MISRLERPPRACQHGTSNPSPYSKEDSQIPNSTWSYRNSKHLKWIQANTQLSQQWSVRARLLSWKTRWRQSCTVKNSWIKIGRGIKQSRKRGCINSRPTSRWKWKRWTINFKKNSRGKRCSPPTRYLAWVTPCGWSWPAIEIMATQGANWAR